MTQEVMALCRGMGAGPDREELLLPLVRTVCGQLEARLREGVAAGDCGPAFPVAAALMAMDQLEGMTGGEGQVTSFTAGELTVRRQAGAGSWRSRTAQAERLMAPWLRDGRFFFQGVKG